ncbi:MAG: hypothetical protein CFE35_06880 [Novosphingobium sp. PASSN1]|nr:MAG: hypothetical protein CFE35_06880 [Novosphingobium sp. PASSN1]
MIEPVKLDGYNIDLADTIDARIGKFGTGVEYNLFRKTALRVVFLFGCFYYSGCKSLTNKLLSEFLSFERSNFTDRDRGRGCGRRR